MEQINIFSLSSFLLICSCLILTVEIQILSAFVIPENSSHQPLMEIRDTQTYPSAQQHPAAHNDNVENGLSASPLSPINVAVEKSEKRRKRWAVPADVQDSLCLDGYVRRQDGKCQLGGKEDNYDTSEP